MKKTTDGGRKPFLLTGDFNARPDQFEVCFGICYCHVLCECQLLRHGAQQLWRSRNAIAVRRLLIQVQSWLPECNDNTY